MKEQSKFQNQASILSVASVGSICQAWNEKPKRPIISKIIKHHDGDYAIVLTQGVSKPIRFLYLTLLTDKNRHTHLRTIIMKISRLIIEKATIIFEDMSPEMKELGQDLKTIEKNLKFLQKKMEKWKDDEVIITELCEEFSAVDPVLILALRAIASCPEYGIKNALVCSQIMTLPNINGMLNNFEIKKDERNDLNKYILFLKLKEIDLDYFSKQGIPIEKEMENHEELFDMELIKYEQEIVIEQMYNLLEQN